MPDTQHATIHAQRFDVCRTPYPTVRVLAIEMIPDGKLSNAAVGGLYPKFLIRVAEYVVITPLEIEV